MTRWCLKLPTYDYHLICRRGHCHRNADALSRHPLNAHVDEPHLPGDVLLAEMSTCPPLSSARIAELTHVGRVLSKVYAEVQQRILYNLKKKGVRPYTQLTSALSTMPGCLLRSSRVVPPTAACTWILPLPHEGHRGIVAIKACTCCYLWWPGLDKNI